MSQQAGVTGFLFMAQRFIHPEIWEQDEWLEATTEQKLLSIYVITTANNIGLFNKSLSLTSYVLGFEVTDELMLSLPVGLERHKKGYWMPKFVFYQYGELKETCKPHQSYMRQLKEEGLFDRVSIPYAKGIHTLKEKDKDIDKDKVKDKIEVSKGFYTEEMESNKEAEQYELYVKFITYLFKNNPTKKPCKWLNLEHQVTYKQFTNLLKLAGSLENLFDKVDIGINKPSYLTGKKVMHTTIKNWMK